ncbi:MAG: polysaccharide biosynthesis/export family protein [Polyangiaceae bacterium]
MKHTGGTYCYPIDDAFIHLAIAKHLISNGVYGVTKYAFSSASSSILWPLLLAVVGRVAGDHVLTPLVLNMVFGIALVWLVSRLLRGGSRRATRSHVCVEMAVVLAVVFLAPLPTLVATGMEHTLQALSALLLAAYGADALAGDSSPSPRAHRLWQMAALAGFAVMTRYEGLFLAGIIAALACVRHRFRMAACTLIGALVPVLAFGAYSIAHGGLFLPNSVLLKGRHLGFHCATDVADFLGGDLFDRLAQHPHVSVLVVATFALALVCAGREGAWSKNALRLTIAGLTTLAHVQFAALGWFFRYEAYLIVMNLTFLGMVLVEMDASPAALKSLSRGQPLRMLAGVVVLVATLGPLVRRAIRAAEVTPLACRNVFEQQVQSARFLTRYFGQEPVAVNDIGAVSYFGDEPIVDLLGLASLPVARAKKLQIDNPLTRDEVAGFTRGTNVAIIYDGWLGGSVPPTWIRLGRWRIENNRSCAFDDVEIYATHPEAVGRVLGALRGFATHLPKGVHQEGRYMEPPPDREGEPYRFQVGDTVDIALDGAPKDSGPLVVQADGILYVPAVGQVPARGLREDEVVEGAKRRIPVARAEGAKIPEVHGVRLRLLQPAGSRVYVVGRVERAGEFLSAAPLTTGDVLRFAGGVAEGASIDAAYVLREDETGIHEIPRSGWPGAGPEREAKGLALVSRDIVVVP